MTRAARETVSAGWDGQQRCLHAGARRLQREQLSQQRVRALALEIRVVDEEPMAAVVHLQKGMLRPFDAAVHPEHPVGYLVPEIVGDSLQVMPPVAPKPTAVGLLEFATSTSVEAPTLASRL